jgi:DNA-binding response OmpR family regulator
MSMKKILLVNSLSSILEKEKSILHRSAFQIFTAMTSPEALQLHQREKFDLIIAELELPEMSGDMLCTRLRLDSALKNVSVLLVCFDTPEARKRVAACGANAIVPKPLNPSELLGKVEQLLAIKARKGYRVLVSVKVQGKAGNQSFYATSHDISPTGMLIETDKALEKGSCISCSFFLPGSAQVMAEATVVRTVRGLGGKQKYGLHFSGLKPEFQRAIEIFVAKEH